MAFKVYFTANDISKKYYGILHSESRKVLNLSSGLFVDPIVGANTYHYYFTYQSLKNFILEYPSTISFNEGRYYLSIMSHDVTDVINYESNDLETVIEGIWNPVLNDFIDIRHANTYYTGSLSTFNSKTETVVASNFSEEFSKKAYDTISKAVNAINFFINLYSVDQIKYGFINIGLLENRVLADLYAGWTDANFDVNYILEFKDGLYENPLFSYELKFDKNGYSNISSEFLVKLLTGDFSVIVRSIDGTEIVRGSTRQISQSNVSLFPKPDLTGGITVNLQRGTLPQRISIRGVQ